MKLAWRIIGWLGRVLSVTLLAFFALVVYQCVATFKDELDDVDYDRAKAFSLDVPKDANHIYCVRETGGLQDFRCRYRFTVAPERVSQAVDEILAQRSTRAKTTRYESLPGATVLTNDPQLPWWTPDSVKQGIIIKSEESIAPTIVADKISGTVWVLVTD